MTKDTFWAQMAEKYPKATAAFLLYIDAYKKTVGWQEKISVKFHEMPDEIQEAIVWRWYLEIEQKTVRDYSYLTAIWLKYMEAHLDRQSIKPYTGKKRGRKPGTKNKPKP